MSAKMAKLIRVVPGKGLDIDGTEFPWYISADVTAHASRGDLTKVTVDIICERVEIDDQRMAPPKTEG